MDTTSRYSGVAQFAGSAAVARHDKPMQHCGYDYNGCIMSSSSEVVHQQECNMCGDVGFADQFQHSSAAVSLSLQVRGQRKLVALGFPA